MDGPGPLWNRLDESFLAVHGAYASCMSTLMRAHMSIRTAECRLDLPDGAQILMQGDCAWLRALGHQPTWMVGPLMDTCGGWAHWRAGERRMGGLVATGGRMDAGTATAVTTFSKGWRPCCTHGATFGEDYCHAEVPSLAM